MKCFTVIVDDYDTQNLYYLLKQFGSKYSFSNVKIFVSRILISQDHDELGKEFEISDMYSRVTNLAFQPRFKEVTFNDGTMIYYLRQFSKNKKLRYPVVLIYERVL